MSLEIIKRKQKNGDLGTKNTAHKRRSFPVSVVDSLTKLKYLAKEINSGITARAKPMGRSSFLALKEIRI
jgi:hypothetical protein